METGTHETISLFYPTTHRNSQCHTRRNTRAHCTPMYPPRHPGAKADARLACTPWRRQRAIPGRPPGEPAWPLDRRRPAGGRKDALCSGTGHRCVRRCSSKPRAKTARDASSWLDLGAIINEEKRNYELCTLNSQRDHEVIFLRGWSPAEIPSRRRTDTLSLKH